MENNFDFQGNASNAENNTVNQDYVEPTPKKIFAAFSLALGIIAIIACCLYPLAGIILGAIGIVLFVVDRVVNKKTQGLAIAGLVCSIVAVILNVIGFIIILAFVEAIEEIVASLTK